MGIGGSIFLIALGAILAFAVTDHSLGPIDLYAVGWILMIAGVGLLLLTLYLWSSRRRRVIVEQHQPPVVERPVADRPVVERQVVRERPADTYVDEDPRY
jgi:hypothetical protein